MFRLRSLVVAGIVATALVACTTGEETQTSANTSPDGSAAPIVATGPAPGVTDDTIKIGAVYVDTEALKKVGLDYDLGPHAAVYQALADDINANGGINGRQLEMVVVPFDPTTTTPGEAQCVQLTEDEDVFLVTGLFLSDSVLCPLEAHATAVVGGNMNPTRQQRAQAPWLGDLDLQAVGALGQGPVVEVPPGALEQRPEQGQVAAGEEGSLPRQVISSISTW